MVFYAQPTSAVISGRASKLVVYTQSTSVSGRRRRRKNNGEKGRKKTNLKKTKI